MSEINDLEEELKKAEGLENTLKLLIEKVKDLEQKKLQSINSALAYLEQEKAEAEEFLSLLDALKVQLVVVQLMEEEAEGKYNVEREAEEMNPLKLYRRFLLKLNEYFNVHEVTPGLRNTLADLSAATGMNITSISIIRKFAEQNYIPFGYMITKQDVVTRIKEIDQLEQQRF